MDFTFSVRLFWRDASVERKISGGSIFVWGYFGEHRETEYEMNFFHFSGSIRRFLGTSSYISVCWVRTYIFLMF